MASAFRASDWTQEHSHKLSSASVAIFFSATKIQVSSTFSRGHTENEMWDFHKHSQGVCIQAVNDTLWQPPSQWAGYQWDLGFPEGVEHYLQGLVFSSVLWPLCPCRQR